MRAAVIIPHHNDSLRLRRCLQALTRQDLSGVEIVVVDNGSAEPMEPLHRDFPQVRFVAEAQKGAAMARNRGVAETTAPRLFFLDCDCLPAVNWLAEALRVADRADIIGGAIDVFEETPPPRNGAQAFEAVFAFDYRAYIEEKGFSVTANLLTRRDVFQSVGPLVPGVSEDLDWCHRARARGYSLICAEEVRVGHPSRSNWLALERKWLRLTRESFGLIPATAVGRLKWGLRGLAMPLSILPHGAKILLSPKLSRMPERLAALGTLIRLRFRRCGWMLLQAAGLDI